MTPTRRFVALLVALSLGAAACASTTSTTAPTLATSSTSTPATAPPDSTAPDEPAPDSNAPDGPAPDETAPDETAPAVVNLFPDIDVLDIADGATVNLAIELGGADKATLLWFFAPH